MPWLTAGEAIAAASGSIVGLLADINIALTADQMDAREGWTILPKVYLVADHCVVAITPVLCLLGPVLGIGILTAVRGGWHALKYPEGRAETPPKSPLAADALAEYRGLHANH
jgi:hypothetical protein